MQRRQPPCRAPCAQIITTGSIMTTSCSGNQATGAIFTPASRPLDRSAVAAVAKASWLLAARLLWQARHSFCSCGKHDLGKHEFTFN